MSHPTWHLIKAASNEEYGPMSNDGLIPKVFAELHSNPQLKQVGTHIGSQLDKVVRQARKPDERPTDD